MIATCVMSDGMSGYGCAVLKRIVYGSTTSIFVICFVYAVKGDGLFCTFGTRSIDATTSAAVNSLPSWNFTPLRSLNSHVVGSIAFHSVARPGIICDFSLRSTR
jgi:hypothetical protein